MLLEEAIALNPVTAISLPIIMITIQALTEDRNLFSSSCQEPVKRICQCSQKEKDESNQFFSFKLSEEHDNQYWDGEYSQYGEEIGHIHFQRDIL